MKKIFHYLLLAALLSGCPQNGDQTQPSASPSDATPAATPVPVVSPAAPAPITAIKTFPSEHLGCCWSELAKADATYAQIALDAANGKPEALQKLLELSSKLEVTPGYAHGAVLAEVLHRIGDARFGAGLQQLGAKLKQPHAIFAEETLQENLRNLLEGGFALNKDEKIHLQSLTDFPHTASLLEYQTEGK